MSEDPDEIFLQPACCADPEVGRLWCEDDAPEDCDAGNPWVRYIHVDKYAELKAEVEALREDAERLDFLHDQCSVTFTFKRPDGTSAMIGGPTNLRVAIDAALAARPGGETNVP